MSHGIFEDSLLVHNFYILKMRSEQCRDISRFCVFGAGYLRLKHFIFPLIFEDMLEMKKLKSLHIARISLLISIIMNQ